MWKIELNKNTMGFRIEKTNAKLYKDNDVIEVKMKASRNKLTS